jgi:hypothetical protein
LRNWKKRTLTILPQSSISYSKWRRARRLKAFSVGRRKIVLLLYSRRAAYNVQNGN